jgi:rhomboid family GlyGly-CTERM serine protease
LLTPGSRRWVALAAFLALCAALLFDAAPAALDWQSSRAFNEPWRALTAVAVHYSALHLGANLAGAALVAALGVASRLPVAMAWAWLAAWPLTQLGLLLRPDLVHYGGLSGVLHAGAAVVAVEVVRAGPTPRRLIGAALLVGLLIKVLRETPWGPALRHPPGWDIATAPVAHATGLVAGLACGLAAAAWQSRQPRSETP